MHGETLRQPHGWHQQELVVEAGRAEDQKKKENKTILEIRIKTKRRDGGVTGRRNFDSNDGETLATKEAGVVLASRNPQTKHCNSPTQYHSSLKRAHGACILRASPVFGVVPKDFIRHCRHCRHGAPWGQAGKRAWCRPIPYDARVLGNPGGRGGDPAVLSGDLQLVYVGVEVRQPRREARELNPRGPRLLEVVFSDCGRFGERRSC